jgi:sugar phosphate isomerase/epimerase
VVGAAVALGFPAVEWAAGPGQAVERPGEAGALRERCDRAGLVSGGLLVQDPAITISTARSAAPYVRLAAALGAGYVRLFAPAFDGGSVALAQRRARDGLDRVVDLAGPHDLTVLVETSPATLAPSPQLAVALVEHHPPQRAAVLYDPGSMAIEGHLAPALAIASLGRHLGHVHVKNIAWSRRNGAWSWRHATIADGVLDWGEILTALAAARYRGRISIDHLGGRPTPALLRRETAELRRLLENATRRGRA